MKIERVLASDLPECADLIRRSFRTVADQFGFTPENAPRFTAFSVDTEMLEKQFSDPDRSFYKYTLDGRIVGYYSLQKLDGDEVAINNLCVDPSARKGGIGAALLNHAFDTAKESGFRIIKISIVEENQVLRKWYESFGFTHTGTIKYDFFPFTCGYLEKPITKED